MESARGIHHRLNKEAKTQAKIKEQREMIREAQEVVECTFKPKINQAKEEVITNSRVRSSFLGGMTSTISAKNNRFGKRSFTTKRRADSPEEAGPFIVNIEGGATKVVHIKDEAK